jgi:outer membrane protein assembly factor BamB
MSDRPRLSPACFIAGARGVLVCPLGAGILVGIDQLTGEFLWLHDYRWRPKSRNLFQALIHNSVEQGLESDFPNPPLIHKGCVYFLAPGDTSTVNQVDHVHCLDLKTGTKIWQTECRDSKYLAVLNDDQLLAVGGNSVQSLFTKDGSTQWSKRVPVIAGVGAVVQQNYLLPVNDGRVMWLSGKDGSEIGFSLPVEGMQIGNLIVHGADVMSENGLELQVFPQATERLAELERRSEADQDRFADLLETGEVNFRLGRLDEAKNHLKRALLAAKSATDRSTVLHTTRELAWRELRLSPEQRAAPLADFAAACELPEHRAQYLLAKGETEVRKGDWAAASQTSQQLLDLNIEQPLRSLDDPERNLTADAWSAMLANRLAQEVPTLTGLLEKEPTAQEVIEKRNPAQIRSFLLRHPNLPESSQVRLALARTLLDDGQGQAAELALWQDHLKNDSAALAACQFLVELWGQSGLYEEAGRLLYRIGTELAEIKGPDGQTGREFYSSYPQTSLVWSAARRFVLLDWNVQRVTITQGHDVDRRLKATFSNWPRSLYFPQSSNQFFLVGQTAPFFLRQIDTETGSVVADFSLPTGNKIFYPHQFLDVRQRLGHFLPSAGSTNSFGISLIDRGIVWQRTTATSTPTNSVPWIGPTSPSSSVFRSRNRLFSLDPSNGKLLWERTDLEEVPRPLPNLTAIPGDDEAILLVEPDDSKTYHVYRRTDGALIREGQLKNCAGVHDHFGRKLLYDIMETPQENRGIRLWDPLTDQTLFEFRNPKREMPVLTSQMSNLMLQPEIDAEFAIAEQTGRVRIIDGNSGKVKLDVELGQSAIRGAPPIKLFSDASRFYLNVQNNSATGAGISTTYADTTFQTHQVMGDLYAFDRRTGEKLWMRRNMMTQSIVHLADYNLPFLVSLNRTGRQNRINNFVGLKLEVIDGQTGQTLAIQSNGLNDRLFLMDYDRDRGRLRFRGAQTQLQVTFGRELNRDLLESEELVDFNKQDTKFDNTSAD